MPEGKRFVELRVGYLCCPEIASSGPSSVQSTSMWHRWAPVRHADVREIADEYDLMLELMVNHISPASAQFQDFLEKGDASEYADMFIDWVKFWGGNGESCI